MLHEKLPTVSSRKTFHQICQPTDQIKHIITRAAEFMMTYFELSNKDFDITILQRRPDGTWHYIHSYQTKWTHTAPESIISKGSSAARALAEGEHFFFSSKKEAAKRHDYVLGQRDNSPGDGSIFVEPVVVKCGGEDFIYLISIVTYRKRLADPWDKEGEQNAEMFLKGISQRIELELFLKSAKIKL